MTDGEKARRRAEELHYRLSGADRRRASTPEDVERALQRAAEARERSRNAHLSAAHAHDLAALAHDEAADAGIGDVNAHRSAAVAKRAERDEELRRAEEDAAT
jgi:hypothetical protein